MSQPRAIYQVNAPPRRRRARRRPASAEAAGFPGCKAVPMTAAEVAQEDGPRIEYWDAEDGFAWMVREGASFAHEVRGHELSQLLRDVARARGAKIVCCGATTFYERGADGEHIRAMEADQTVFLDADRAWTMPSQPTALGEDPVPDVVVEVDHTTDARRRKLREYEKWRFPEVWVEVPDAPHRSRPRNRPSALTIHLLCAKTGRYVEAAASRALPGWTAAEIHLALNERRPSAATLQALERVGRALGEREGTAPTEDPLTRRARENVHEEDRAIGGADGRAMARNEGFAAAVLQILAQRGIAHSPTLFAASRLADHPKQRLVAAALACDSEADFLARLAAGLSRRRHRRPTHGGGSACFHSRRGPKLPLMANGSAPAAGGEVAGRHLIIECFGSPAQLDADALDSLLQRAAVAGGAQLLSCHMHPFGPGRGVTGVALLAESHITVHTWPERGYAAFDVFMCGACDAEQAAAVIAEAADGRVRIRAVDRPGPQPQVAHTP